MIKYCLGKWEKNKDTLKENLSKDPALDDCNYLYLVKKVVTMILNDGSDDGWDGEKWSVDDITEIDNGDYCGTLLYLIPRDTYQPSEHDYLMAYVGYGSCSGCDTLLEIQSYYEDDFKEDRLRDYMALCKDIVCSIIKPYNSGWRYSDEFEQVEFQKDN